VILWASLREEWRSLSAVHSSSLTWLLAHPVTDLTSGHIFDFAWSRDSKDLLLSKGEETSDVLLISNFR